VTKRASIAELDRLFDDLEYYGERYLKITQKRPGPLIPLSLNRIQRHIHARLERQIERRGYVRAIVLKGRQTGVSTYVAARFYHRTSLREGLNTFILSHRQDSSDALFDMVHRFWEHCPLRPHTDTSNAKELIFDRLASSYAIGTAGSTAVGRSRTVQLLQGDEAAHWPNAQIHFAGVVQAVPLVAGTEIVLPSTANGVGNEFHALWQQAEAGQGDYEAIFVPWFWADDYALPVPEGFALDRADLEYQQIHGLSMGQMVWRASKIAELRDPALFQQEYPATAAEAFLFSGGDSFVKAADVARARKAKLDAHGPLVVGVDPKRFGDDRFSLAWRRGRKLLKVESHVGAIDTVAGANIVKQVVDRDKPDRVFVDLGGTGAGVFDILVSWGEPYASVVAGIDFGGSPQEADLWVDDGKGGQIKVPGPKNRRAEIWMRSRDWLQQVGGADIPDEDSLQADACGPGYSYDMQQRVQIESKEHLRARGLRSPDEWDAVALTFAEPVRFDPPKRASEPSLVTVGAGAHSWLAS
jgi:hypothetical protein